MPYEVYKVLHITGVFMVMISLGGVFLYAATGGEKADNPWRKMVAITHGVGLLITLVAGFGLLARLGLVSGMPGWAWAKLVVWLLLGAFIALAYRRKLSPIVLWWGTIVLGAVAAYFAGYKPF